MSWLMLIYLFTQTTFGSLAIGFVVYGIERSVVRSIQYENVTSRAITGKKGCRGLGIQEWGYIGRALKSHGLSGRRKREKVAGLM